MPKDFPKKINTTEAATKILFHVLDLRHNGCLALVKTQDKNTRAMPTGQYWVFPNTDPCGTPHGVTVFFVGGGGGDFSIQPVSSVFGFENKTRTNYLLLHQIHAGVLC